MCKKKIYFNNDYSLIDGRQIVRGHKTEYALEEFLVAGLEKIKFLSMHIALTEEQADTLIDCIIDEHFTFGGDMNGFADTVQDIGNFLDYYLVRQPKMMEITDEEDAPDGKNASQSSQVTDLMQESDQQPF